MTFVNILIISVTLMVVAVPEGNSPAHTDILQLTLYPSTGLPTAVTIALAFATKRMTKDNLLVRVLESCETMANASVICTNKTGTLTQNEMSVVACSVGVHAKFVRRLEKNRERTDIEARRGPKARDFAVDLANLNSALPHSLKQLFNASIAINSTAFEDVDPESGDPVFIGNKTEAALLRFAKELGWPNYKETRDSAIVVQMIPFLSERKSMGCVVRLPDGTHRLYVKGASEILTRKCTRHVLVKEAPGGSNEVETVPIGELENDNISHTIRCYASETLRTIALCYRDFSYWPPKGALLVDRDEVIISVQLFDV